MGIYSEEEIAEVTTFNFYYTKFMSSLEHLALCYFEFRIMIHAPSELQVCPSEKKKQI